MQKNKSRDPAEPVNPNTIISLRCGKNFNTVYICAE